MSQTLRENEAERAEPTVESAPPSPPADFPPRESSGNTSPAIPIAKFCPPESAFEWFKFLLFPIVAAVYLAFCYTVYFHVVPVPVQSDWSGSVVILRSGLTALTVFIIHLGLWPLHSLINELKSEEFFRTLSTHPDGVPLSSVNSISSPLTGVFSILRVTIRRHCSPYLSSIVVAVLLTIATSTLAPATLGIGTRYVDGDLVAFEIGAIFPSMFGSISTMISHSPSVYPFGVGTGNYWRPLAITWARNRLSLFYSFTVRDAAKTAYIVPVPKRLSPRTPARWLTDTIALQPSCRWEQTDQTKPLLVEDVNNWTKVFTLPRIDLEVLVGFTPPASPQLYLGVRTNTRTMNHTINQLYSSDGSTLFVFSQSLAADPSVNFLPENTAIFNLSKFPTVVVSGRNLSSPGLNHSYEFAFLSCHPHISVRTHEVQSTGDGSLIVQDSHHYTSQHNLDLGQTKVILGKILEMDSGIVSRINDAASQVQLEILFGVPLLLDKPMTPIPIAHITKNYKKILQSTVNHFLWNTPETTYVPGRVALPQLLFTVSLGHLVASSLLMAVLFVAHVRMQFRVESQPFTLITVGASLATSHVPIQLLEIKHNQEMVGEQIADAELNRTLVQLDIMDGKTMLHLSNNS